MSQQTVEPLAEIKLSPERPTVDIDGERYELKLLEYDFSVVAHHELERDIHAFDKLWGKDKLSKKEGEQLKGLLDGLFGRVVVDWPAEVVAKLTDVQRRQVISVFQLAPQLTAALAEAKALADKEKERNAKPGNASTTES